MKPLTYALQKAVEEAHGLALRRDHAAVEFAHLLRVLLEGEGSIAHILRESGANASQLRQRLEKTLDELPRLGSAAGEVRLSNELARIFQQADKRAEKAGDRYIASEQLLLAALKNGGDTARLLQECGASEEVLAAAAERARGGEQVEEPGAEESRRALEKYTVDLTAQAEAAALDPVIGRDDEIRRTVQVLQRRTKNNPVLIGEPGVGKTAIVEGLAQRIVNGEVPVRLRGRRVLALDLGALLAGAKYRGEFEERLQGVLKELKREQDQVVLFIDELHNVVGAGRSEGSMDAGNMLKPALARGELHCVGATTLNEYREYIEKDAALERRFQKIMVDEPGEEETVAILRGLRERYEVHHGVNITDPAIIAAVRLSRRYITDRNLPDKAIDLVDEAASRIRMEIDSKPEPLDRLERRLVQLKIEREAIRRDKDQASRTQLEELEQEISGAEKEYRALEKVWESEKERLRGAQQLKEELEQVRSDLESAQRTADLGRVAELQHGVIPELEQKLQEAEKGAAAKSELLRNQVTEEEIAAVVSRWTGVPVERMLEGEREKLLRMEEVLHQRVVGQDEAVSAVADAVRRARAGLADARRPNGSFLFLGPTGVGKTELCRALANFLFDSDEATVRIDMSEFMERHAVSRLIGAPPGYVGYEEGGYLTEAVRRRPYSVLLLDEVEKAHPDVFNILLQVLEDGRLTDGHGRTVDFCNTVVVMTSNLGSDLIRERAEKAEYAELQRAVLAVVQKHFRPEFLNRIDETVVFHPLERTQMNSIVRMQLKELEKRLQERDLALEVSEEAMGWLVDQGYDPAFGARPLRRVIQRELENPLSRYILSGKVVAGSTVGAGVKDGQLVFSGIG